MQTNKGIHASLVKNEGLGLIYKIDHQLTSPLMKSESKGDEK